MIGERGRSTLFPYTTLFRSLRHRSSRVPARLLFPFGGSVPRSFLPCERDGLGLAWCGFPVSRCPFVSPVLEAAGEGTKMAAKWSPPRGADLSPRLSLFSDHLRTVLAVKGSLRWETRR